MPPRNRRKSMDKKPNRINMPQLQKCAGQKNKQDQYASSSEQKNKQDQYASSS